MRGLVLALLDVLVMLAAVALAIFAAVFRVVDFLAVMVLGLSILSATGYYLTWGFSGEQEYYWWPTVNSVVCMAGAVAAHILAGELSALILAARLSLGYQPPAPSPRSAPPLWAWLAVRPGWRWGGLAVLSMWGRR